MARPAPREVDEETIQVPASVRFPVELTPPDGFDPARLETWPRVEGRLEWVEGRLLYMPPCGKMQEHTVADLVTTLGIWVRSHPVRGRDERGRRAAGRGHAGRGRRSLAPRRRGRSRPGAGARHPHPGCRGGGALRRQGSAPRQGALVPRAGRRGRMAPLSEGA